MDELKFKIQMLMSLIKHKKFRQIYNYLWLYLFWKSEFFRELFLIKLYPYFVPYPPFIEVEVTTKCNLKCVMCEHTYWNAKGKDMSFEEFKKVIDQFPRLKWVGVTGIGTSFLNKDFLKMLEYLESKFISVYNMYDTFFYIDKEIAKKLIELGPDIVYVSIDGATKETYERIRVGSNFERVINNIKNFIQAKKQTKKRFPQLIFHYIVSKDNVHEMVKFVEFIHSLDADEYGIIFTPLLHNFEEINGLVIEIPQQNVKAVERKAKELGAKVYWSGAVPKNKPPISKCTAWIMPFIFVTGEVIPCCAGNEANRREFQKKYSFGNIFEKSFKEIWCSEEYKRFRDMIHRGEVPIQCTDCPVYDT